MTTDISHRTLQLISRVKKLNNINDDYKNHLIDLLKKYNVRQVFAASNREWLMKSPTMKFPIKEFIRGEQPESAWSYLERASCTTNQILYYEDNKSYRTTFSRWLLAHSNVFCANSSIEIEQLSFDLLAKPFFHVTEVKGHDIALAYNSLARLPKGSIHSCMSCNKEYLAMYAQSPRTVSLFIFQVETEFIRALCFTDTTGRRWLERRYGSSNQGFRHCIEDWMSQHHIHDTRMDMNSSHFFNSDKNGLSTSQVLNCIKAFKEENNFVKIKVNMPNNFKFPYLDTFSAAKIIKESKHAGSEKLLLYAAVPYKSVDKYWDEIDLFIKRTGGAYGVSGTCILCGEKTFLRKYAHSYSSAPICHSCYRKARKCDGCGTVVSNKDLYKLHMRGRSIKVCKKCFDKSKRCDCCGYDTTSPKKIEDKTLCLMCYSKHVYACSYCGHATLNIGFYVDDYGCVHKYGICPDCEKKVKKDTYEFMKNVIKTITNVNESKQLLLTREEEHVIQE